VDRTEEHQIVEIESLPVFPLPSTVLFPGIVIPLHVFEPRYRRMVADAMASDETICLAMIKPGTEERERPEVHDVAGMGRIIHCDKLIGGRYNILVQGIARVHLVEEIEGDSPYRRFRARVVPNPTEQDAAAAQDQLVHLESCIISLVTAVAETDAQLVEVVRSTPDPIKLADILAATVVQDSAQQQALLATTELRSRLALLIDRLTDVLATVGEIPPEAKAN
jgi:Lon protease-like protein